MPDIIAIRVPKAHSWTIGSPNARWLESDAHILDESTRDEGPATARLLVSVFGPAYEKILEAVLVTFDEGIQISASSTAYPVRFSIDGSLTSALVTASTLTFVVAPDVTEVPLALRATEADPEILQAGLTEALTRAVADATENGGEALVKVWTLDDVSAPGLFSEKIFHEFRFGVLHSDWTGTAESLSAIAKQFASQVGAMTVPLAYLFFPFEWPASETGPLQFLGNASTRMRWMRVAVGMPYGILEPLELQLAARQLASEFDAALCLYNPTSSAGDMEDRFDLVFVPEPIRLAISEHEEAPEPAVDLKHAGYVFAESEARPGLVSDILDAFPSDLGPLFGGSMTVLHGHTVAAWVCGEAAVKPFESAVRARLKSSSDDRGLRTAPMEATSIGADGGVHSLIEDMKPLWIAWRCPERRGVVRRLLESLDLDHDDLEAGARPRVARPFVVEYMISRVLEDGETCAGKIRLRVKPDLRELLLDDASDVRRALQAVVLSAADGWQPSVEDWVERPLLVGCAEPVEEPWARLALDG